ncbi:MAG TPA: 2,3,4,5-tetrahydropyridine-2,6-dicarboxylate N-succinyltransferase [bacterium]|nr:2,3,4,5-tetrahydropyridine-2,6-dicarboxylate N-succinyltransferase [bacterium]
MSLINRIEAAFEGTLDEAEALKTFEEFMQALNDGSVRAAEKKDDRWTVNGWVKKGILLGFRLGEISDYSFESFSFYDKSTFPLKTLSMKHGLRIVPGGSSIRNGCYIGKQVTCMPPMYINVGAYVDDQTMVDSHALIGSCAQIGKRVHISAGSQIGGVLEPIGSLPVIIEDDVLIGGNCGIYEGTVVRKGAVIGAGTVITGSTPVYDLVLGKIYKKTEESPLQIPPRAVVIPGTRPVLSSAGREWGLSVLTPIIIKYKDDKTKAQIELESFLR